MKVIVSILLAAFLISIVILAPLVIVWSLNTLFTLAIPYSFWTWLAVVVLNLTWFYKP